MTMRAYLQESMPGAWDTGPHLVHILHLGICQRDWKDHLQSTCRGVAVFRHSFWWLKSADQPDYQQQCQSRITNIPHHLPTVTAEYWLGHACRSIEPPCAMLLTLIYSAKRAQAKKRALKPLRLGWCTICCLEKPITRPTSPFPSFLCPPHAALGRSERVAVTELLERNHVRQCRFMQSVLASTLSKIILTRHMTAVR